MRNDSASDDSRVSSAVSGGYPAPRTSDLGPRLESVWGPGVRSWS